MTVSCGKQSSIMQPVVEIIQSKYHMSKYYVVHEGNQSRL